MKTQACYFFCLLFIILYSIPLDLNAQNDCPTLVMLNEIPVGNDTTRASDTIISTEVINSSLAISYKSGNTIILRPGFEVNQGATFSATIQECIPRNSPNFQVLLDEQNEIIAVDSHIITLSSSLIEDSLVVGVYILSSPQEFLPNGFIGRINAISKSNDKLVLTTSEAKITDFIESGKVSGEIELTSADIDSSTFSGKSRNSGFEKTINQTILNEHGFITFNGHTNLTLSLVYNVDIEDSKVSVLELGVQTDLNSSFSVNGEYMRDDLLPFSESINLGTIVFKPKTIRLVIPVFPYSIPVTFTPILRLDFNSEGKISASFSANANAQFTGINTIVYENSKFSQRQDYSFNTGGSRHFNAEANVKAEIIAGLEVQFYNNNVTLSVGTGFVAEAEAELDLDKGLECSLKVSPKVVGKVKVSIFNFKDSLERDTVFEPYYEDSTICKPCNLQIVDSTLAKVTTDGNFELRARVTTSCGNLPVPSHPVVWSYTIDETNFEVTSFTDQDGLAKLDWTVPEPRVYRPLNIIYACADQSTCSSILINRQAIGLVASVSKLNYRCNDNGDNDANITGNIGLNLNDFQYVSNFNASSSGNGWLEIIPLIYSTGNPDNYPLENLYEGIFFYDYSLNTNSGFIGQITFSLTAIGGSFLKDINLIGEPREVIDGNKIIKYRNHGHGTGAGVTITISPYQTGGVCWSPFSGGENVDVEAIIQEPNSNFESGNLQSSGMIFIETYPDFVSENIEIYPNPAHQIVTIKYLAYPSQNAIIEIVDMFGNSIVNQRMDAYSTSLTIDVSTFIKGTYFLKYTSGNEILVKKLIVQN